MAPSSDGIGTDLIPNPFLGLGTFPPHETRAVFRKPGNSLSRENSVLQRCCPANTDSLQTFEGDVMTTENSVHLFWKVCYAELLGAGIDPWLEMVCLRHSENTHRSESQAAHRPVKY